MTTILRRLPFGRWSRRRAQASMWLQQRELRNRALAGRS